MTPPVSPAEMRARVEAYRGSPPSREPYNPEPLVQVLSCAGCRTLRREADDARAQAHLNAAEESRARLAQRNAETDLALALNRSWADAATITRLTRALAAVTHTPTVEANGLCHCGATKTAPAHQTPDVVGTDRYDVRHTYAPGINGGCVRSVGGAPCGFGADHERHPG